MKEEKKKKSKVWTDKVESGSGNGEEERRKRDLKIIFF